MLNSLTDQQLDRLVYSLWDFQQSLSALTFLMEDCDFEAKYKLVELRRFRCYETSTIVSFARPFEVGRGEVAIGLRAIGCVFDEGERALQERLLALRHKVVAHSDEEWMEFAGTVREVEDGLISIPYFHFRESLHLSAADLRPLEALLRKLTSTIYRGLFQLAQENPARLDRRKIRDRSAPAV